MLQCADFQWQLQHVYGPSGDNIINKDLEYMKNLDSNIRGDPIINRACGDQTDCKSGKPLKILSEDGYPDENAGEP